MERPRRIVITGASGAIGNAVALRLAQPGRSLILLGHRNRDALAALSRSVQRAGADVEVRMADLSDLEAADRLAADIVQAAGPPDSFVHAAGESHFALLQDLPLSGWRNLLDLNLGAPARLAARFLPGMVGQQFGRIVFVGSIYGTRSGAMEGAYAAAKAGLMGLCHALVGETARSGVTVNVVAPGAVDTPMLRRLDADELLELDARIPVGRLGSPAEVAHAVHFLLSEEAGYITGACLPVDGGWSL